MTDLGNDSRVNESVTRSRKSVGETWGWIAGIAVLVLIAIILIAGWNSNNHLSSNPTAVTTGSATKPMAPPASTTGAASETHPVTPVAPKH